MTAAAPKGMKMDPESVQERFTKRKNWFMAEASRQASNRAMMAKCESFYDGNQWRHEDAEIVRERGQHAVVYNEVKPTIDWLLGTERKTRVDFFVSAEEEGEAADEDARAKTKLMKYLDDTNRAQFERSYAFEDAVKAGIGWIEAGLRGDKSGPPIYIGAESWRNILWDSQAPKRDITDGRYLFRIKVVDLDVAIAVFPDKEQELRNCVQTGDNADVFRDWMGGTGLIAGLDSFSGQGVDPELDYMTAKPVDLFNARERVLLIECWSREPFKNTEPGPFGIADPVTFKIHCAVMTERDMLIESWSPFKHDRFPFIPVWAYRNRRTGLPYSPILPLIGPQEALNHRMSRSLYEASSNQVWLEEDAFNPEVMDIEELRAEIDAPDGTAIFAKGALAGNKVRDRPNQGKSQFQMQLAQQDTHAIRQMSGVNGESRGLDTNSISGKAVLAKQAEGGLLTMELFDNALFARQMEGEMTLALAEQFITQKMTVRTMADGKQEYITLNDPQEDGTYKNDITQRRAHFVVGEQAWKQSFAEAAFESLMQVMTQLASAAPQVVIGMLDVVFEMHPNLPKKATILQRIRQINGQVAPDGKMSPEQQQAKQQADEKAKKEYEMQMAKLQADIKEAVSKGEKLDAEAMNSRLESLYLAAQAAQVLVTAPTITPVADELLKSAGYVDKSGAGQVIDPVQQPVQPTPQPMPEQAPPEQSFPPLQQMDGGMAGSETMRADGVDPSLQPIPNQPSQE